MKASSSDSMSGEKSPPVQAVIDTAADNSSSSENGPAEDEDTMSTIRRRIIVFSLCLVQFLTALDITILATALPTISRTLSATAAEYAWIGSSYALASTALTPVWAKLSDVFGKKSMLMLANACFMAGSLVAALASSAGMLIAGRTMQGIGAGGIQVLVTILVGALFEMEDRAKYYGITAGVWAVAAALGPVLGGVFTERLSWRWCFYINLPLDGASLVMLFFALRIEAPRKAIREALREVDWVGAALIVAGTVLFLLGLETGAGGLQDWTSAKVICLMVVGVLLLALFPVFEAKAARDPLIPLRVFCSRTNAASFMVMCLHSIVFVPCDYFIPLYLQVVLRLSPLISGVSMFALVIPLTIVTCLTGVVVKVTGNFVWPMYFGSIVMTVGTGLFIDWGAQKQWAKIVAYLFVAGIGAGPVFQLPILALQAHTAAEDLTAAMSAMNFMKSLFTSISIVVGSVILQSKLGGSSLSDLRDGGANRGDYVEALQTMWIFYTCVSAAMVPAAVLVKSKDIRRESPSAVEK